MKNACCTETAPRKMLSYLQELIIRSAVLEKGKEVLTMAEYVKLKDTILEGVFGWCESAEGGVV